MTIYWESEKRDEWRASLPPDDIEIFDEWRRILEGVKKYMRPQAGRRGVDEDTLHLLALDAAIYLLPEKFRDVQEAERRNRERIRQEREHGEG